MGSMPKAMPEEAAVPLEAGYRGWVAGAGALKGMKGDWQALWNFQVKDPSHQVLTHQKFNEKSERAYS